MRSSDRIERAGLAMTLAGLAGLAVVAWCVAAPVRSPDPSAWSRLEASAALRRDPARIAQFDALVGSLAATDPNDGLDLVLAGRDRERRDPRAAPDPDVERGLLVAAHFVGSDDARARSGAATVPASIALALAFAGLALVAISIRSRRLERTRIAELCGCEAGRVRANGLAAEVARALVTTRHGARRLDAPLTPAPGPDPGPGPAASPFGRVLEISYADD